MRLVKYVLPLMIGGTIPAAEPVTLDTGTGVLYGTLELPTAKPPYPAVLIIAGSGPTDRDGNSAMIPGKNDSLKMIAEGLAGRGIASLRYDKRGIAQSAAAGAKESDLRFEMYVDDATRWGQFLRKDSRFSAIVIAGHSEGSLIGMLAAEKLPANGYVSISGIGERASVTILKQLRAQPIPADLMTKVEAAVKSLQDGHTVDTIPPGMDSLFRASVQPYLISWFRYDPPREIAKLKMPVLILQGTTDIQVKVDDAKVLAAANPTAKLVIVEGMNHVLKAVPIAQKEQIASYGDPSLPVVPRVIDEIADLVHRVK